MEIERKIDVRMSLEALVADEATIDETEADILGLFTRPTADLGEDGELERHARQMREDLCGELPNGVSNTIDALLDRLILYREALVAARPYVANAMVCQDDLAVLNAIDAALNCGR